MNELNLDKPNKLKMQTPNKTNENIENILKLFPNVSTEIDGKKAIDFDLLRQMLSEDIVEGDEERYRLDWPGKKASLLKANTSINKTLRPCKEESVNFDNTQNLYIEGDNFEVLKILSESYLNKIKMIYIDPPYNTGKDFVYKDNFTKSKEDFEDDINLRDEEGNKLFKNTDSNGRFHSDWLSMMYERLLVARDLLKDDGVIFISIDDNEVHNLRKICDEVFGEGNFINEFAWRRTDNQSNIGNSAKVKEYILCYGKIKESLVFNKLSLSEKAKNEYSYSDENGAFRRKNILDKSRGKRYYEIKSPNGETLNGPWMLEEEEFKKLNENGKIYWASQKMPYGKKYLHESDGQIISDWLTKDFGTNQRGSNEIDELFKKRAFDFPKPTKLIETFVTIGSKNDDLILDFFSGSATTAHAVMNLNAKDGGNRKFIMVQLPELTDEKSEAYKAGYKTIAEIGKERIRRAGKKILEENSKFNTQNSTLNLDIGFRVLKTDTTNFKDVYYHPNQLGQGNLLNLESNIKEDRTHLDLLFAIMIDLGIELSLKITPQKIDNITIYSIENSELIACFENNISEAVIEEIIKQKPYQVVLKDGCFSNDSIKINIIQKLATISTVSVI